MELEKLNTTQVVLLVLLVSFVTSIATGIATVSLMEKAPADVTRVINRIIEKPIETIIQGEKQVVTETVVIRESELIAQAVSAVLPSVVRIYETANRDTLTLRGFGVIMSNDGRVLTNRNSVEEGRDYTVTLQNGTQLIASGLEPNAYHGYVQLTGTDTVSLSQLSSVSLVPYDTLELGESVVAIGGGATPAITSGIISALIPAPSDTTDMPLVKASVQSGLLIPGSPLINLDGKLVGVVRDIEGTTFAPLLLTGPVSASE